MDTMVNVTCALPSCGKPFQKTLAAFNISKTKRFYCCRECLNQAAHDQHGSGIPIPTRDELEYMLYVEQMSYPQIGERYKVDQSAVFYWRKQYGIDRPDTWLKKHSAPEELKKIKALYDDGLTLVEIADAYGVCKASVNQLFRNHNIPLRKDGWNADRYIAKDGTKVRSSYERKVADWLADQGIAYIYEPSLPFANIGKADFLANGWYIEVWGVTNSPSYKARKSVKCAQYQAHNVPLIEIPAHAFNKQHDGLWERKLTQCLVPPLT